MNERIRDLAEQSGIKVAIVLRVCGTDLTEWQQEHLAEIEKFARLIVAECVEQVEQAKNSPFVSLDDAKRMKHFVDVTKKKIQKHFGVEE